MTSFSDGLPTSTIVRGAADDLRIATFGRQLAPSGATVGVGDPAEWLKGREAGYEAGLLEAGREQAAWLEQAAARDTAERDERARVFARALAGLERSIDGAVHDVAVDDVLATATRLAVELAEALVGHHLEVGGCAARDAVLRAVSEVPRGSSAVVRVNPDDTGLVAPTPGDLALLAPGSTLELVADPSVERGGCVVDVGDRTVDARIGAALQRVREVLAR